MASAEIRRECQEVQTRCPCCEGTFIHCSLLADDGNTLTLHCGVKNEDFQLPHVDEQREHLKKEKDTPSQIEQVQHLTQLSRGDIIAYTRIAWAARYLHLAVILNVNYDTKDIEMVEFAPELPLRRGEAVQATRHFDRDIRLENPWVIRYMPLDCLPVDQVVQKAKNFIASPSSQPKYELYECSCEHLAIWCKTGMIKTKQDSAKQVYYKMRHDSFVVYSLFSTTEISYGTRRDTIRYESSTRRSEFDLIDDEMKSKQEKLRIGIASALSLHIFRFFQSTGSS